MMEWTFGITDSGPKAWRQREPFWEDEQLTATSKNTYHQVMQKLCETALAKRREGGDSLINSHLWKIEVGSQREWMKPPKPHYLAAMEGMLSESDASDDEDDEEENNYRGITTIMANEEIQRRRLIDEEIGEEHCYLSSNSRLSNRFLQKGLIIKVTYDFGHTTTIYLKVLSVLPKVVNNLLKHFDAEKDAQGQLKDLQKVPAHKWPKDQQIDAFFPNYSKAFLGEYQPLFLRPNGNADGQCRAQRLIGSASLGLSAKIRSEKDVIFANMEDATCSNDLMFAPMHFRDMNEFMVVAEQSWTPRDPDNDPDNLKRYRYNGVSRYLLPKTSDADEAEEALKPPEDDDNEWAAHASKRLLYRLSNGEKQEDKTSKFDFVEAFPKTAAQFASGKFRWIQYKKGILRVLVGRGTGEFFRDYISGQVLRKWTQDFASFHELLCAVEASWIYCKQPLTSSIELAYFDADLGPSNPGPKEPPSYGKTKDTVPICRRRDRKQLVTAMAVVEEAGGMAVLYAGTHDGTLTKWSLENNTIIWIKSIYQQDAEDDDDGTDVTYGIKSTFGVAGIAVRWDERRSRHRIYTWTHAHEGYPSEDYADREPSRVKCWRGDDASFIQEYVCDVGDDDEGNAANPSIATVVFCRLWIKNQWRHSMVVGLHCICDRVLEYDEDCSDFDLEAASEIGEGNILPFYEFRNNHAMESWRGHFGIIRAMAVVPDKYLLSYSMRPGHGLPDAMILWDLQDPGVPLRRHDFWNPRRSLFKQNQTRLHEVCGISVSGTDVLLCCEYGDRLSVFTVEDEDGDPCIELHGYANIGNRHSESDFHGRMAMSGKHAVIANEGSVEAWLFQIEGNSKHEKLDKREGNRRNFQFSGCEEDVDEEGTNHTFSGRHLAIGKVSFLKFGGEAPKRKKQKLFGMNSHNMSDFLSTASEHLGSGGPIALAIHGKWLVAGFINGTIARSPLLPIPFAKEEEGSMHANELACCSSLPSDEWHHPVLACEED
ncbi:expressed unknown protein [Seminavis robusta]|uniref:Uncharacterized protein n=1 Tax=Seminavis robusta TaxID=568900 RepID=A0A9N8DYX3_9STRA|nr:expressed unknown protein [Seminavis robusta]|eukprot:Sro388_g132240.1 n/a (992) ;mRNA; f:8519-11494